MKCPVCGGDCVASAHEIMEMLPTVFAPCPDCRITILDKHLPPEDPIVGPVCSCGKRFIDDVFVHCWIVLREEGIFSGKEPLSAVGMPLVHPGFAMNKAPFLPPRSLVLLSRKIDGDAAGRLVSEVPEIRGVVRTGDFIPGIENPDLSSTPKVYELLAGCDVRAGVFETPTGSLVIYLEQSRLHIEFPRQNNPKIESVFRSIKKFCPRLFIDASCGAGTLGLSAARLGISEVVMNDAWYAAAFWAAFNVSINSESLGVENIRWHRNYDELKRVPVGGEPLLVAETVGPRHISVYHGDMFLLHHAVKSDDSLTAIDLFNKMDRDTINQALARWRTVMPGEIFIP